MTAESFDPLTETVLAAIFEVANTLGAGFLEKVYHRALLKELRIRGLQTVSQPSFRVMYKGECVGEYFADILVDNVLMVMGLAPDDVDPAAGGAPDQPHAA